MMKEKIAQTAGVALTALAILAVLVAGRAFLFDLALVDGKSMLPGLKSGDLVLVVKAAYGLRGPRAGYLVRWGDPQDGDLVIALRPDTGKAVLKRVWMEGENGHSLFGRKAPEGFYYLLGDNEFESLDSREFGPVPMNNVVGKAYPLRLPKSLSWK
jgi:signal peptidase I